MGLSRHVFLCALGVWVAAPVQAQSTVGCSAVTQFRQFSPASTQNGPVNSYLQGCDSELSVGGFGAAVAQGDMAPGVLKVDVSVNSFGQSQPRATEVKAAARTSFSDVVRFNVPGAGAVSHGTVTLTFLYNGFFQVGGPEFSAGFGRAQACVSITGFVNAGGLQCSANGTLMPTLTSSDWSESSPIANIGEPGGPVFGLHTVTLPVRLNRDVNLNFSLSTLVSIRGVDQSMVGAFDNSAYWGGIVAVRDAGGNLLTLSPGGGPGTYSLVNSSGFDWHASLIPVPEPGTYGLMLLGLGLFYLRMRRLAAG